MMRATTRTFAATAAILALASCGGEDGGGTPPPPTNAAPVFTSLAAASTPENSAGTVYTARATDADNDPLTYSITGGADAALFAITATGELSFRTAPDFEAPTDAGGDNVHNVTLAVSDGRGGSASLALALTVTNLTDGGFRVRRIVTGFAQPLYLTAVPGSTTRVFVVEQGGRIRILDTATGTIAATPFLDVSASISSGGERGLLGFTPAPDFTTSGTFYINVTNPAGDTEIRRYRTQPANRDLADIGSADLILGFTQPFANHNGGWMDFGPDGFLYIASGDGGSGGDPQDNAQNRNNLLGKMLRIDPASDAFPADSARDYAIPSTNPFAGGGGAAEIYAFGLRNPFRASFDRPTGNLYIGDVGQNAIEEIDLIPPGRPGLNFGWARLEGTQTFNGMPPAGATPPVTEYGHGTGPLQGNSVTGGYVYRGPIEQLQGLYIFGDFVRGAIWSIPASELVQGQTAPSSRFTVRTTGFAPATGTINNIASFGTDARGNIYIVDYDGDIFVVEPA